MLTHSHDENNAPDQADNGKPTDMTAHLARGVPGAEPPLETDGATDGGRDKTAAGFHAIYETGRFGLKEMGVKRSFETLLKLNQKNGFDCPSCAWPDPDGKRNVAEFCENGAKAVASEATTKRLTPEIFAQHSISKMLRETDLWLEGLGRITHPMIRRKNSDHYEAISWEDAFELMRRLALEKDQWVDLISHFESETRRAGRFKVVPYEIPLGCAAAYFPETNVLVPIRDVADKSNQPASKSIVISIEPTKTSNGESHAH